MDVKLEGTHYFDFITSNPNSGAAQDADSGPTCEIFEDATDTTVYALAAAVKRTSKTGNYRQQVDFTASNGFEVGKCYNLIASATVAGVAGKAIIGHFRCLARSTDDLAFPATSGRSMVVDADGLADANVVKVGPTGSGSAQTARDIGAGVLVADKTGWTVALTNVQGIKKNTAGKYGFVLRDVSGDPAPGLTVTATRRLDGATSDSAATGSVTGGDDGSYWFNYAAADTNCDSFIWKFAATGAKTEFLTGIPLQA